MDIPSWWWKGVLTGIILIALGGAFGAVENGYRDVYYDDCNKYDLRIPHPESGELENDTSDSDRDDAQCRSDRLRLTWMDAVARATLGPGIAIVSLGAVYLIAVAIASRRGD